MCAGGWRRTQPCVSTGSSRMPTAHMACCEGGVPGRGRSSRGDPRGSAQSPLIQLDVEHVLEHDTVVFETVPRAHSEAKSFLLQQGGLVSGVAVVPLQTRVAPRRTQACLLCWVWASDAGDIHHPREHSVKLPPEAVSGGAELGLEKQQRLRAAGSAPCCWASEQGGTGGFGHFKGS